LKSDPLTDPLRRRLLRATAAGAVLALPGARALAQREGVQVGPRSQFESLVPAARIEAEAARGYHDMLAQARARHLLAEPAHPQLKRLVYISERLRPFAGMWNERAVGWQWEVNLIGSPQINAFCMPGGKIAFYSGIINKLKLNDDEIAIVMGHEITHALKEHGVEQAQKQAYGDLAARAGGALLSAWLGINPNITDLGARAANSLFQLRFSRGDESEADGIGLELAARAGYDPRAGVVLWQKMGQLAQGSPPQWLSSHPADTNRIAEIQRRLPAVLPLYAQAVRKPVDQLPPYRSEAIATR